MDAEDLTEFAVAFFGEGCITVFNEMAALYNELLPDQQQVLERFMDMLGTGLKVGFEQVDAATRQAVDEGMDAVATEAVRQHALYVEGYAISVAKALLRRGMSQAELQVLLSTFDKDALEYVKNGKLLS